MGVQLQLVVVYRVKHLDYTELEKIDFQRHNLVKRYEFFSEKKVAIVWRRDCHIFDAFSPLQESIASLPAV